MSRLAAVIILFLGLSQFAAAEAANCLDGQTLCEGDQAYGYDNGKLIQGQIEFVTAQYLKISGQILKAEDVARVGGNTCVEGFASKSICPGAKVDQGDVLAIFPKGFAVVKASDGTVSSLRANKLKLVSGLTESPVLKSASAPKISDQKKSVPTAAQQKSKKPSAKTIEYFRGLLARADSAPIEDFLKLWFPEDQIGYSSGYINYCLPHGATSNAQWRGMIDVEACKPDVLYSWGPVEKLNNLISEIGGTGDWSVKLNDGRGIWATISPISTYSYGLVGVRFKIKKDVPFTPGFYRQPGLEGVNFQTYTLMDYLFDSGSVIESWSYGTPEQYDEIVKDIKQIISGQLAITYWRSGMGREGWSRLYSAGVPERGPQDEYTLRRNLKYMIQLILQEKGRVFFAPGVPQDRAQHFATEKPTYFNER